MYYWKNRNLKKFDSSFDAPKITAETENMQLASEGTYVVYCSLLCIVLGLKSFKMNVNRYSNHWQNLTPSTRLCACLKLKHLYHTKYHTVLDRFLSDLVKCKLSQCEIKEQN